MLTKICTKCGQEKPATTEYFGKQKHGLYGLRGRCIECRKEDAREYHERNKDKKKEYAKQYRTENKDKIKEYCKNNKEQISKRNKEYREKNKSEIAEKKRLYREANKDKISQKKRIEYQSNRDAILERVKKHYSENIEEIRIYKKQYTKENLEKCRISKQKRKARIRKLPNTLTLKQWNKIKFDFSSKCAYCGRELPLAQEHFIPLSKGGEYTVNNIIPSCQSCNSKKHNNDFFIWYPKQDFYSKERETFILKYLGYKKDAQQLKII